ncbi:MAG: hypothetical protein KJ646_01145 [Nanoarchaeota archaeon]|nr:hypothetical protein [Nanoarchaeota archaeon]MBU4116744.1 hypothetical protein [Nanoarchaeota archaeon]
MNLKQAAYQSWQNIWRVMPFLIGIVLLISILSQFFTKSFYSGIFKGNIFLDPLIGSLAGSISVGAPAISYILGGEMLAQGVSLVAITAFIISWVSVGILSFPVEAHFLGKKFTLIRNILSFVFSIIVAIIAVFVFNLI